LRLFAGRELRNGRKEAKDALQVIKKIVVTFIELQRVSPANSGEIFPRRVWPGGPGNHLPRSRRGNGQGMRGKTGRNAPLRRRLQERRPC
jgi:hypothetical protein